MTYLYVYLIFHLSFTIRLTILLTLKGRKNKEGEHVSIIFRIKDKLSFIVDKHERDDHRLTFVYFKNSEDYILEDVIHHLDKAIDSDKFSKGNSDTHNKRNNSYLIIEIKFA